MKTKNIAILSRALALAALGLSLSSIQQVKAAGFVEVSPMNRARYYHSATLLPNGKVLVAGGIGNTLPVLFDAELFDPATGTWTQTGRLGAGRLDHTATLLPTGKVLVAGGEQSSTLMYDPASGTWTATGALKARRAVHTATLLPNGKVLVAGGNDRAGTRAVLSSAELYDPASGTWSFTGAMRSAREGHTATLLPNGKVLVAGGNSIPVRNAELYDPLTGMWTDTGALSAYFSWHTATLLPNGKVLVAGGRSERAFNEEHPAAELYDPASGTWTPAGPMITGHGSHAATLLPNGKVLVVGGSGSGNGVRAELYDPDAGTWTETATMIYGRWEHTATLLPNGNVLVAGGNVIPASSAVLSSAEIYEADADGAAPSITILHHANELMTFSWSGAGTLEQSDSLAAPNWQPSPIQDNPQNISTTGLMKFFRVKSQ